MFVFAGEIMKIGVITDIHSNLPALKAVMERLDELNSNQIICCGDMIGIGPYPEETVQFVMNIPNLIAVRGNHEKYLLEGMPSEYPNEERMSVEEMKHHKWEYSLLSLGSVDFLKSLPYRIDTVCEGHTVSVLHYCMDRDGDYINYRPNPSEDDLKRMFSNVASEIVLYGHDHQRNICKGNKLYINVDSLGCPAQSRNIAWASVVNITLENIEVQTIDVQYEANLVVDRIDQLNYPDAGNIKKYFYGVW